MDDWLYKFSVCYHYDISNKCKAPILNPQANLFIIKPIGFPNLQILPSLILLFDGLKHAYEAQHENEDSDDESEDDDKVFNAVNPMLRIFIWKKINLLMY